MSHVILVIDQEEVVSVIGMFETDRKARIFAVRNLAPTFDDAMTFTVMPVEKSQAFILRKEDLD